MLYPGSLDVLLCGNRRRAPVNPFILDSAKRLLRLDNEACTDKVSENTH
jgi:hypothetical protein